METEISSNTEPTEQDKEQAFLKSIFTEAEPFGPISAERFDPLVKFERNALDSIFSMHDEFRARLERKPKVIFGRRGSGKTSALMHSLSPPNNYKTIVFCSQQSQWRRVFDAVRRQYSSPSRPEEKPESPTPSDPATSTEPVINANTAAKAEPDTESSPARKVAPATIEEIALIWRDTIRSLVFWEYARQTLERSDATASRATKILKRLAPTDNTIRQGNIAVKGLVEVFSAIGGSKVQKVAAALSSWMVELKDGSASIQWDTFERKLGGKAIVLLNSAEEYDFRKVETRRIIQGFLKFISAPELDRHQNITIQIALPTEHLESFESLSISPLADFSDRVFLHWSKDGLINLAAQRYAKYMQLWGNKTYPAESEFDSLEYCKKSLGKIFDEKMKLGEEPLQFILRHTQLLPRHFLSILNNLVDGEELLRNDPGPVGEQRLRSTVLQNSALMCSEIFRGFSSRWPHARHICDAFLPFLPQVFEWKDFEPAFKKASVIDRIKQRLIRTKGPTLNYKIEPMMVLDLLMEIGAVGRVLEINEGIVHAEFDYAYPGRLIAREGDKLCIHPIFSTRYESRSPWGVACLVVPVGSEVLEVSEVS
jgi:hypothetical protein